MLVKSDITHPLSGELLTLNAGLNEITPLLGQFGWQTDEQYYQQQFAALFSEDKWPKSH